MSVYFLLEGKRTEAKIYPAWLDHIGYSRLASIEDSLATSLRTYFCFSAEGYPSIVQEHLKNAIEDIRKYRGFTRLAICLDVDEDDADERRKQVEIAATEFGIGSCGVNFVILLQCRCIESWLLGNSKLMGASPDGELSGLRDYYDVSRLDPEMMGTMNSQMTRSQFHEYYLRMLFKYRRLNYSKRNPGESMRGYYFDELRARMNRLPGQLSTFKTFVDSFA